MTPAVALAASFDRVYVGRLPRGTTEPVLREAFSAVGVRVRDIDVVMERATGASGGFAFVLLCERIDPDIDPRPLARLRRASLDGYPLDVRAVRESGSLRRSRPRHFDVSIRPCCGGPAPRVGRRQFGYATISSANSTKVACSIVRIGPAQERDRFSLLAAACQDATASVSVTPGGAAPTTPSAGPSDHSRRGLDRAAMAIHREPPPRPAGGGEHVRPNRPPPK